MKRILFSVVAASLLLSVSSAQDKRYGVERCVVKSSSEMMGMKVSTVQYIDDWGAKESSEALTEAMGQKINAVTLIKDNWLYSANLTAKQGTKVDLTKLPDYSPQTVNFLNLSNDAKKKFNITEEGSEKFLNRDCKKYSMTTEMMGQSVKSTVWVWKGITLKSVVSVSGQSITSAATEIMEVPSIPAKRFELPAGIDFKDITEQMLQMMTKK